MKRLRNILVAVALVGFSVPTPAVWAGTCAAEMRPAAARGCCGATCACAAAGRCECSRTPASPDPQPLPHQAADPAPGSPAGVAPAHAAGFPAAHFAPAAQSAASCAANSDPAFSTLASRRLALLGTLLI